jgi:hypothetical protein
MMIFYDYAITDSGVIDNSVDYTLESTQCEISSREITLN